MSEFWKKTGHVSWKSAKILLKTLGVVLAFLITVCVGLLVFVFANPRFTIHEHQVRWALNKFVPQNIEITFDRFEIRVLRPKDFPLAKRVEVEAHGLCVRYENEAVHSCLADINLAATGGWGGRRLEGESKWIPNLLSIDPVQILGGTVNVDLAAFPKPDPNQPPSSFDLLGLLRKQILPKWQIEGSRVEVKSLALALDPKTKYTARFDLVTADGGDTIRATLLDAREVGGPLRAISIIRLTRPENGTFLGPNTTPDSTSGTKAGTTTVGGGKSWKVVMVGDLSIDKKKHVGLEADANVTDWQNYDFRVGTKLKGLSALREARIEAGVAKNDLNGKLSLKMGEYNSEVKALDFVNCAITADLDKKEGRLGCGPQSVRLQVRELKELRNPKLFTFQPEFELKVTRLDFGQTKRADLDFQLRMNHQGVAKLNIALSGSANSTPAGNYEYNVKGTTDLVVDQFRNLVKLVASTPYSMPAPMRTLSGPVGLHVNIDVGDKGGKIDYQSATKLDSKYQAVHLNVDGITLLDKNGAGFLPRTDVTLSIDDLRLSAPRFDLRAPPRFNPDSRFVSLADDDRKTALAKKNPKAASTAPMDFRLRVRTTQAEVIRISTNLTKAPIPVSLDVVFDDRAGSVAKEAQALQAARAANSSVGAEIPVSTYQDTKKASATGAVKPSPVTGWVTVGSTPVDLFRRNAVVDNMRVDLLADGRQKLDGQVSVNYLDYSIKIAVGGYANDPQIRFTSEPYLEEKQIMAVLIFGRPLDQLDDGQKDSVNNMNAAVADAALGVSSLYLLASTPIESVGYDAEHGLVTAKVGLGGGASLEVGSGANNAAGVGLQKRLSKDFVLRSDVERIGTTGKQTVSALIEWVRRF